MKMIELSRGLSAVVDDVDYERVSQFKWSARKASNGRKWYAVRNVWIGEKHHMEPMHRFLTNPDRGLVVDHADGNGLNNTRANLRVCTQADNVRNRQKFPSASKFKGVTPSLNSKKNPWRAQISFEDRNRYLGRFKTEEDAATAYNFAAAELFGEFALFNEVEQPWLKEIGLA